MGTSIRRELPDCVPFAAERAESTRACVHPKDDSVLTWFVSQIGEERAVIDQREMCLGMERVQCWNAQFGQFAGLQTRLLGTSKAAHRLASTQLHSCWRALVCQPIVAGSSMAL